MKAHLFILEKSEEIGKIKKKTKMLMMMKVFITW